MIFYCPDRSEFCLPYIYNGAKCEIIEICEYTVRVLFNKGKESCLVSKDYLIPLDLWRKIKRRKKIKDSLEKIS